MIMRPFSLTKIRQQLDSEIGIANYLGKSLEEFTAINAVMPMSCALLGEGVRCILVGYDDAGHELLAKAKEWLEYAVSIEEKPRIYFRGGTEAGRFSYLALCTWLVEDVHDEESLLKEVEWQNLSFSEDRIVKGELNLALPSYVDAGEFRQAVELFESKFKAPKSLKSIRSEGAMAYVIAKAKLGEDYSTSDVADAVERFFRYKFPEFMKDGQYIPLAHWTKIAYWNDKQALSAPETVRKCLDYLSGEG